MERERRYFSVKTHDEEKAYLYWLHQIPEIGEKLKRKLVEQEGSAKAVYRMPEMRLEKALGKEKKEVFLRFTEKWNVTEEYERLLSDNMNLVSVFDHNYPERLRKIRGQPMVLYYRGALPEDEVMSLAIIGARECSAYGSYMAKEFARKMAMAGINIISGMARGVDGIGQLEALRFGGTTYAVLGCGVDVCYPASNRCLYQQIQEKGGILSPYVPGTPPVKNLFPYRNKIVAGLSDAVLVVEARQKSGTLITVDMALEQGKDVYAVPGRLTDRLSDGCNLMIRQGAGVALSPEDILAEMTVLKNRKGGYPNQADRKKNKEEEKGGLPAEDTSSEHMSVLKLLDLNPRSLEELFVMAEDNHMDMTLSQLTFELIQLCMAGKAKQTGGNFFSGIPN